MTTISKPEQLLFRFRPSDTVNGISRRTLARLAQYFGYTETQVLHYALKRLATEVLPNYEHDQSPLTTKQLKAIKKAEPQGRVKSVKSSLV